MDRSGLTSIEDTSSAGILPTSRDSPKFKSEAQFPGNSPFQKPHTAVFRAFRGVRAHPAPRGLYGTNFGLFGDPPRTLRPFHRISGPIRPIAPTALRIWY